MRRKELNIHQMAETSGVSERTIRYYIELGLLHRPRGTTRAAVYTEQHLTRVLDIRRLRLAGHSLDAIKRHLNSRPSKAVIASVQGQETETRSFVRISQGLWVCYDPTGQWRNARKLSEVVEAASEAVRKL